MATTRTRKSATQTATTATQVPATVQYRHLTSGCEVSYMFGAYAEWREENGKHYGSVTLTPAQARHLFTTAYGYGTTTTSYYYTRAEQMYVRLRILADGSGLMTITVNGK